MTVPNAPKARSKRRPFHLLHRVLTADGEETPWRETRQITPRSWRHAAWFPDRRRDKAMRLAERVGEIVGVDASPDMLDVLRDEIDRRPLPVEPVLADIRDYEDERRYGLVYCVCGTLSMVLDEAGRQRVLETCARAVAPGGAVVIETHNPGGVEAMHEGRRRASFFVPYPGVDTGLLTYPTIDPASRLWQLSHIWFEEGRARVANELSRPTTPREIDAYAEAAGLRPETRQGDWTGAPFGGSEPTVICTYRA